MTDATRLIDETFDPNPTWYLDGFPAVTLKLSTHCHDMGMRAYFKWKGYSQERANEEYDKAYLATLRQFSPNHPHLKHAPEGV